MTAQKMVEVIETDTGKVEKALGPYSERGAERAELGVLANMNRDAYHTRIVPYDPAARPRHPITNGIE
jgi:hypothetical protein